MNLAELMRPSSLDQVIGNDHIVTALSNQFNNKNISQTMMFTGDSGSGKTTFAKIIASQLDAEVLEIDCGSDGSIDKIREVVDSVKLSSLFSKTKVFILDEVHALSKPGQSALLKTIEDPQKDVYFILLTTEPKKILNTIRTRCVEYHTSAASTQEIGEAVKRVEVKYNIHFEDRKDLWSLVEQSNGSLRQVYAFLEKLIAASGSDGLVTSDMFHKLLGKSMEHVDENLPKAFLNNDLVKALSIVSENKKSGGNPTGTLIGIYNYLKVVLLKNPSTISKSQSLLMADLSYFLSSKEVTWELLEHLSWKHLIARKDI